MDVLICLAPPLAAVALALWTRQVNVALFLSILFGAWLVTVRSRSTRVTGSTHPVGWGKYARLLKQTTLHGFDRVDAQAKRVFASYNLVRIAALEGA